MHPLRSLLPILCAFLICGNPCIAAEKSLTDSLQQVLARTSDPETRIELLINLKDLNEDSEMNVPLSIRLFREAVQIGDTYAMSVAIVPIINRYASYPEKDDSLHFYVLALRRLTPGTPQEGFDQLAEMSIAVERIYGTAYAPQLQAKTARETREWCRQPTAKMDAFYHAKRLILWGYTAEFIDTASTPRQLAAKNTAGWEEAFARIRQMDQPELQYHFAMELYPMLCQAYTQQKEYSTLIDFTTQYIAILDAYFHAQSQSGRRPYLYADNAYVEPYKQLIRSAYNLGRTADSEAYYKQFQKRLLGASGLNLIRNKTYLYETGYLWRETTKNYNQSLRYSDSLIALIASGQGYYRMKPRKIIQAYYHRGRILRNTGQLGLAFEAYDRTYQVVDSLHERERNERLETILRHNKMDRMKLSEMHSVIRNHAIANISAVGIVLLLCATGVYFYQGLRRNRKLQSKIIHLSRKAQESERMKSNFLNSICNDIRAPFLAIDQAAWRLMIAEMPQEEREEHLHSIRKSTAQLLSTLDNILEASSLGSLTEGLRLEQADILALCRAELEHAARQYPSKEVEYLFESSCEKLIVQTHARYFSLVVRALLDNAAKFTPKGRIILRVGQQTAEGMLRISVSDAGPGVPHELRENLFSAGAQNPSAGHGQSLALCSLIALHMQGSISLDEEYLSGARFIFSIPVST